MEYTTLHPLLRAPTSEYEKVIISAGHMAYDHYFLTHPTGSYFVKEHVAHRFTDPEREHHSRLYLQKEAEYYDALSNQQFGHIPADVGIVDDALLGMEALTPQTGWHWRAPVEASQQAQYITSTLAALDALERIPHASLPDFSQHINPSHETYWREGWDELLTVDSFDLETKALRLSRQWNDTQIAEAMTLMQDLVMLRPIADSIDRAPLLTAGHNDARQANIAWHPDHGVRLVDWSWADPTPEKSDHTMFLIDLAKSGVDISPYKDHLNKQFTVTLIGFWLAHSMWPTRDGDTTVREQQLASAVAAWRILQQDFGASFS